MFAVRAIEATDKAAFYRELCDQLRGLLDGESDAIANAANTSALIFQTMPDINWAGFYFLQAPDELVVGPFQGKPACVRIAVGKGVSEQPLRSPERSWSKTFINFPAISPAMPRPARNSSCRSCAMAPCSASSISTVLYPAGSTSKTRPASKGWRPSMSRLVRGTNDATGGVEHPSRVPRSWSGTLPGPAAEGCSRNGPPR